MDPMAAMLALLAVTRQSASSSDHAKRDSAFVQPCVSHRAFFDLCFTDECLKTAHDMKQFNEQELNEIRTWQDFYLNDPKYAFVGTVIHESDDERAETTK